MVIKRFYDKSNSLVSSSVRGSFNYVITGQLAVFYKRNFFVVSSLGNQVYLTAQLLSTVEAPHQVSSSSCLTGQI